MVRKKAKANSTRTQASAFTNNRVNQITASSPLVPVAEPTAPASSIAEESIGTVKKASKAKTVELAAQGKSVEEAEPVVKKTVKEQPSEKAVKMKRLTLDIAKPLHKAIKAKAVEEGIPMVDMLRSLLEKYYGTR